ALGKCDVHTWLHLAFVAAFAHVLYHADDGKPGRVGVSKAERQAVSEWVLVRPVTPRQRFVHHDDLWRIDTVAVVDQATRQQLHAQRLQVRIGADAKQRIGRL